MNDELLVEAEPAVGRHTMGAAFDADGLWRLANLPDLATRLANASRAGGFEGVALVVTSPDAEGAVLRLVEEGRRLASSELVPDVLGSFIAGMPEPSSVPFRWIAQGEPEDHPQLLEAGVLRERGRLPVTLSGICVPVRRAFGGSAAFCSSGGAGQGWTRSTSSPCASSRRAGSRATASSRR